MEVEDLKVDTDEYSHAILQEIEEIKGKK